MNPGGKRRLAWYSTGMNCGLSYVGPRVTTALRSQCDAQSASAVSFGQWCAGRAPGRFRRTRKCSLT